ncbi:MAG: DJ-1/PfpI family protein [Elusimicrobiota bacterium]|jgi:transcriptional regulator GlxA family with amidase domain|nr:DJ-1/PfpI family protein [Elusimicrobiota bacterium]
MIAVATYIYDDVETLDFSGPCTVFSYANKNSGKTLFQNYTFSDNKKEVRTQNDITITADHFIDNMPSFDVLLIPGGPGSRKEINNKKIINLILKTASDKKFIISVCTGALLMAKAGLLNNSVAPTHRAAAAELAAIDQTIKFSDELPFIYDEKRLYIQTSGVLTGITGALFFVKQKFGAGLAEKIYKHMYCDKVSLNTF